MKNAFITFIGAVGSVIAYCFGGFDSGMITLLIFMALDFLTGLVVAGIFKRSPKTETGALQSKVGFRGLAKKCVILAFVLVATRLDLIFGTDCIRDGVVIAFILNELISIVENAGLMGVPIPKPIRNAIDMLHDKTEDDDES